MGYIYKITNNLNGKIYVGQTYLPIEERFKQHINDSKNKKRQKRPLYYAINKYGKENFSISLIEEVDSKDMNEREQYWIKKLNTYTHFDNSKGYNATLGGDSKKKYDYLEIVNNYNKYKNKTKVSKLMNCSYQTINRALNEYNLATFNKSKGRKIYCLNDNKKIIKKYNSINQVAKEIATKTNKNSQTIRKRIDKILNENLGQKAYGFYWKDV